MIDLWFTEKHSEGAKFSIHVKKHLYSAKSPFQQIDFFESEEFGKFFTLDGIMMANEKDEFIYHEMITHVPLASNPLIKKVLVIGGGDGGTVRELTKYTSLEEIHMVEIDEMVVKACREYLPITACKLDDPRVKLYFEDGLAFVKTKKDEYDLILVDSTDPIGPGEGLFSKEFYENCFEALTKNGILINQHESPYYPFNVREMKRAHNKIKDIFPISEVYQFHMPTYPSGHWLFGFASKGTNPLKFDAKKWNDLKLETKYYNTEIHSASFALPNYVKDLLANSDEE